LLLLLLLERKVLLVFGRGNCGLLVTTFDTGGHGSCVRAGSCTCGGRHGGLAVCHRVFRTGGICGRAAHDGVVAMRCIRIKRVFFGRCSREKLFIYGNRELFWPECGAKSQTKKTIYLYLQEGEKIWKKRVKERKNGIYFFRVSTQTYP
jgi:hypothetical protein